MPLSSKDQAKLLKLPALITVGVFVLLVLGLFVADRLKPSKGTPIVEAAQPAVAIRNLVFVKEGGEYVLYFSFADAAGNEVARPGEVSLKISQLGTIGIEDGPQFVSETPLLEATFDVTTNSYRWIDIGGAIFFTKRQLIVPKRIAPDLFKLTPRQGQLGKISLRFRDAKLADSRVQFERRLRFP